MTHPLTDSYLQSYYKYSDGPYDEDDMRSVADWQLERVIEQWEEVIDSDKTDIQIIREFDKRLKAMRPQENNNV